MAEPLEKVYDLAYAEIEKISRKQELTKESLCVLKDVVDIVKDIGEIMAQEYAYDEAMNGYSGRRGSYARMSRAGNGGSYNNGGGNYNSAGGSYARGGGGRRSGRYNSYDDGKDYMLEHLSMAMDKASSEEDRNMIGQLMDKLNS